MSEPNFTRDSINDIVDSLDASVFSGDAFHFDRNRSELRIFMKRWEKELKRLDLYRSNEEWLALVKQIADLCVGSDVVATAEDTVKFIFDLTKDFIEEDIAGKN